MRRKTNRPYLHIETKVVAGNFYFQPRKRTRKFRAKPIISGNLKVYIDFVGRQGAGWLVTRPTSTDPSRERVRARLLPISLLGYESEEWLEQKRHRGHDWIAAAYVKYGEVRQLLTGKPKNIQPLINLPMLPRVRLLSNSFTMVHVCEAEVTHCPWSMALFSSRPQRHVEVFKRYYSRAFVGDGRLGSRNLALRSRNM